MAVASGSASRGLRSFLDRRRFGSPHLTPSVAGALGIFALLYSVYLLTFSGVYHSTDEMAILVTTDSVARRGGWDIDLIRWTGEQQGAFGPDGHLYSNKGLGTSLAALPLYWPALNSPSVGNVQAGMLTNALVTALTGSMIYLLLSKLRFSSGVSMSTALAFGFGTMAWPYARYLFGEPLVGLCLVFSAYALLHCRERCRRSAPFLAGLGLGLALLTRLNVAVVVPFYGLLLLSHLYRQHGRSYRAWIEPMVLFGLPIVAALAIVGWSNWLRFGAPLATGYPAKKRFTTPFLQGLYGLVASPGKGLLWYNPIFLAAVIAWPALLRRDRDLALLVAAVVLGCVAFYSPWRMWWAGHSWGPRFLVVVLPLASLPLASALEAASGRLHLAIGLGLLALASAAVQVLAIVVGFNLYLDDIYGQIGLYHPATFFNPAYSSLPRQFNYLRAENLDLAWARGGAVDWPALLAGLLLVLAAGLGLLAAHRQRQRAWKGGAVLLLLATGTVFLMLRYAPAGNVTEAARALARMERPGEAAVLTDSFLTEEFQNAYDGRLAVWGLSAAEELTGQRDGLWSIGTEDTEPAAARFHVSDVRLDLYLPPGSRFEIDRLPVPPLESGPMLGEAVKLVAVQLSERSVRAGTEFPLVLYWRSLAPMETSYTVFVHVVDAEGTKVGQVDRLPCRADCPTTTWQPGDLVALWYDVPVESTAPPGRYEVIAGLYDLSTGGRLTWRDEAGNALGESISLGSIEVEP